MTWAIAVLILTLDFAAAAQPQTAKDFPTRPVRIVIGFAAGGGNDLIVTEVGLWTGFHVPAGTPRAIVARLHEAASRVIRLPESVEKLAGLGVDVAVNTSAEFRKIIEADIARWSAVAKAG